MIGTAADASIADTHRAIAAVIPVGVVNVLTSSDNAVGAQMTTHPDIDVITFTGSTPVGRQIMAAAEPTFEAHLLQLGGKSAFVLLDDDDPISGPIITPDRSGPRTEAGHHLAGDVDNVVELVAGHDEPRGDGATLATVGGRRERAHHRSTRRARQREKVAGDVDRALADGAKAGIGGRIPEHLPRDSTTSPR